MSPSTNDGQIVELGGTQWAAIGSLPMDLEQCM